MAGRSAVVCCSVLLAAGLLGAKEEPPASGVVAVSVEDSVLLLNPATGRLVEFETGPVGWLFEGPGGVLFAPDLVNGRTTVIDTRSAAVADRFDGITMPHFAPSGDRYAVVAGEVLLVTYPERAVITRFDADIQRPWQVEMISDTVLLALERSPDQPGEATLDAVDMVARQVVFRHRLPGDVQGFALSLELGLLAVADASTSAVTLMAPATMTPMASLTAGGPVRGVAFCDGPSTSLAAIAAAGDTGGELRVWVLKSGKDGIKVKKERSLPLEAAPSRLAVAPAGDRVAVALDPVGLLIVNLESLLVERTVPLPAEPRDVVWCDPSRQGPLLPDWSDDDPPELRLGPK